MADDAWRFVGEKDAPDLFSPEMAEKLGIRVWRNKTEGHGDYHAEYGLAHTVAPTSPLSWRSW